MLKNLIFEETSGDLLLVKIRREDLPPGAVVVKKESSRINIFAEIVANFSDRVKVKAWALDLTSKPEEYLSTKEKEFIASNVEWDWKRLLTYLPSSIKVESDSMLFSLPETRLSLLIFTAKNEKKQREKMEKITKNNDKVPDNVPNITASNEQVNYTAEDIPF